MLIIEVCEINSILNSAKQIIDRNKNWSNPFAAGTAAEKITSIVAPKEE